MCGISFIFNADGSKPGESQISRMVDAIKHRGPDAQTYQYFANASLGHTRLSIVDLDGGDQPMTTKDGRYTIVFNGEIYNFKQLKEQLQNQGQKFASHSDTEAILSLYAKQGESCVEKLRGMFSFAIYDQQQQSIFISRDRLGIKPLFYSWNGNTLVGASEMKAIFASGLVEPGFNLQSIRNFFNYQFNITPHTCFKNVVQLPPGHSMTLTLNSKPVIKQYWDIEFPTDEEYEDLTEQQWTAEFEHAMDDAAISHMIGDVPIGAYLSGGIDSTTTTYLLQKHYPQSVNTFTMRFTNPNADESAISRNTASHLNVANRELIVDDDREGGFLDVLEKATYAVEQPQRLALEIPLYLLSGMVQQQQYKVVYTGDGADEILGGYDCFRQDYIRIWGNTQKNMRQRRRYYLNEFKQNFSQDYLRLLSHLHRPKNQQQVIKQFGCYPVWNDFWHILDEMKEGLFVDDFAEHTQHDHQMEQLLTNIKPRIEARHPLNQSLYIELKTRLPDWILWKTDRMTMAHSVEARVPFLDHPLVELTARMPPHLKLNQMHEKYVLHKMMQPHLPRHPESFKKRAFYTPIREWLFNENNLQQLDRYLSRSALLAAGVFKPETVQALLSQLLASEQPQSLDEYYKVMQYEWILTLVLTIQILYQQFILKKA